MADQHSPAEQDIINAQLKELNSSTEDEKTTVIANGLCNGISAGVVSGGVSAEGDSLSPSNDGMSEFSNRDLLLPEVCVSANGSLSEEDTNYEVQQAYRIFSGFLSDKHKGITNPFLNPVGHQEAQHCIRGVKAVGQSQLRQSMCLQKIEKKFVCNEYETITEFVTDFRLMLENCYRYHGVDHWISKQAQKLELMLEQKLTLLSRALREKTTLAVTSKGHFGTEEDRSSAGTSTRRRLTARSTATLTVGGHESVMVQTLRLEEQQRAKEEKRQRELEKKEAEETSAKEVDEWEQSLLSQAHPQTVDTLWELPAIGHFLCLAQRALNLPEIVFFELERCLLMPRSSQLLSKIMSSLLSAPHRRTTLHRHPPLPYRRWESELRHLVMGWYRIVGSSHDQPGRAQKLGLCHQFFTILGEVSPLEEKPFHLLLFHQRVWLLKGLCDHVYETHKDVQDAVLSQPIHECRESILGYDRKENSYIHFPHFCGADLRIYCQSPSTPPAFPFPLVWVKRVEGTQRKDPKALKDKKVKEYQNAPVDFTERGELERGNETQVVVKKEKSNVKEDENMFKTLCFMEREVSGAGSSDSDSCGDSKVVLKMKGSSSFQLPISPLRGGDCAPCPQEETSNGVHEPERFTSVQGSTLGSVRIIKANTKDPCLNVGEHSYTGRSPARSLTQASSVKSVASKAEETSSCKVNQEPGSLDISKTSSYKCKERLSSERARNLTEEKGKGATEKKRIPKKQARVEHKQLQHTDSTRPSPAEAAKLAMRSTTVRRKEKKKKNKTEKKLESSSDIQDEPSVEPSFKLVCTNLEDLRDLISKTEDELDDLESTKSRLGRWYYRKEAVKELHSTLIRLLNELSPWEPKLVKAYQRNRLRLKKEFDDFKNHPEYNNFVREECISSSSTDDDDDDDDDDKEEEQKAKQFSYHFKQCEEDQEFSVPQGLWSGGRSREIVVPSASENLETFVPSLHSKEPSSEEGNDTRRSRLHSANSSSTFGVEVTTKDKSRDSENATRMDSYISPKPSLLQSTIGLPKRYTPIPTLLAKSVGNKVTLMKQPTDCPNINSANVLSKESSVTSPYPVVSNVKMPDASSPSCSQSLQEKLPEGSQQIQILGQNEATTLTTAFPKLMQGKPTQTVSKGPIQLIYRAPEGVGQLVVKDGRPMKFSVHPVIDKNTGKTMQQMVILPSNLLAQKTEETKSNLPPLQSTGMASNVAGPLRICTDVSGFTIPENNISAPPVVPLKDEQKSPSPVIPYLQQGFLNSSVFKGSPTCGVQTTKSQNAIPTPAQNTCAVSSDTVKTENHKQELRTVCIRDSQSILVTTRGGNTGIVKVQSSSDQKTLGSFPASPVITISPQLKAFLVSKTLSAPSQPFPPETSPSNIPTLMSNPESHSQKQHSGIKLPVPASSAVCTRSTSNSPTTKATLHPSHGFNMSPSFPVTSSQLAQTTSIGSLNPGSVDCPPSNNPSVSQILKQDFIPKTGLKRACEDEESQVRKFLLLTPNSPKSSNMAQTKGTPSSTKTVQSSRVLDAPQTVTTSATGAGIDSPAPAATTGTGYKANSVTPSSGAQIKLLGKMTTIGQSIGALSYTPVTSLPSATIARPVHVGTSDTNTLNTFKLPTNVSSATSSQPQGISPLPVIAPKMWVSTLPAGNVSMQDCGSPTHVMNTMETSPANASKFSSESRITSIQSGNTMDATLSSPSTFVQSKTQAIPFTGPASGNLVSHSSTATVQQRIVINNSAPLAAGTQILLNNACFVVPPQGLGPGNHVLIVSQVPNTSATGTGGSLGTITHQTPTAPHYRAKPPVVPTKNIPFVACTPAAGQASLTKNPPCTVTRSTAQLGLDSILTSKANVEQSGNTSGPPIGASTLVSCPAEIGCVPNLLSQMKTSSPAFNSPLAAIRLAAPTHQECSSTVLPAAASPVPQLSKPQPSVPHSPGQPAVLKPNQHAATNTSALHGSFPTQRLGEAPVPFCPPTAAQTQALPKPDNPFIQKSPPVQSPARPGTLRHALPTVAVSLTTGPAARMQTLPIAAFPLIRNHFHINSALGGSTTVTSTPLNPPAVALAGQEHEKTALQNSTPAKWDPSFSST